MTQVELDIICKTIQNGVPALANDLLKSLQDFVVEYNDMKTQLEEKEDVQDEETK